MFKNSANIKKEFSKYFPNTKIKLAFSLKAGGLAIHLETKEDLNSVLNYKWPTEAFNNSGNTLLCHTEENKHKLILRNINPNLSIQELEKILFTFTGENIKVHRFTYRDTGKPIPVVKLTLQSEESKKLLLERQLIISSVTVKPEQFKYLHQRQVTCLNCHQPNHIASQCHM